MLAGLRSNHGCRALVMSEVDSMGIAAGVANSDAGMAFIQ